MSVDSGSELEMMDIDFEIVGDVPEIELPVKVAFIDERFKKPVTFKASWVREDPEESQAVFLNLLKEEKEQDGADLIRYQAGLIADRLVSIKDFPTKTGKKIAAGNAGQQYSLDSWLQGVLKVRSYHTALFKSMLNSLAETNIEDARRKN